MLGVHAGPIHVHVDRFIHHVRSLGRRMSGKPCHETPEQVHADTIVDSICDRFEAAWRSGKSPRTEDFVAAVSASLAPRLLAELLTVEIQLRIQRGDPPDREEFLARFPDFPQVVEDVFEHFHDDANETIVTPPPSQRSTSNSAVGSSRVVSPPPETADRYVIQGTIGRGAFGAVYSARDLELERDVALKLPHRRQLSSDSPDWFSV
mgnify:CR=1 FL=1